MLPTLLAVVGPAVAVPYVPDDDAIVLEHVPVDADPERAALARDPANRERAVRVARTEITRGQRLADARYFGRAEAALSLWLNSDNPPTDVRLLRGILRQTNHQFAGALDDLDQVLQIEPRNGQARLARAIIRTVRADYSDASDDCAQLAGVAPPGTLEVCVAAIAGVTGHARPSLAMLRIIAGRPDVPTAIRLWSLTLRGEIAARTRAFAPAFAAFKQARALVPDDTYLLAAYADALMQADQAAKVGDLLGGFSRTDGLLLRLVEAAQKLGRTDPAQVEQLADRFATSRRRGETIHQREEARFALHILAHPAEALRLAKENWQVQHEPADAQILLEAALAANARMEAAPVLAWLDRTQIEDTELTGLAARLAATP